MIGTGMARVSTPQIAQAAPTNFPIGPSGTLSPYPTVVIVIMAHQNASGMLWICVTSVKLSSDQSIHQLIK